MTVYDKVTKISHTNAHGEVNFVRMEEGSISTEGFKPFKDVTPEGHLIVGHSETGNTHLLEADGVTVLEKQEEGMKILYAILTKPVKLWQSASHAHAEQVVEPGTYIITNAQEYDPFVAQARRVAD